MIAALGLFALLAAQDAAAIERRVASAPDGTVRLQFTARAGVVGDGRSVIGWDCDGSGRCRHHQSHGNWDGDGWHALLKPGPVRVSLRVSDHKVYGLQTYVGGSWRPAEQVTDLGTVPAAAAQGYLLQLARGMGQHAGKAIFAATLADSATIWPELIAMARDKSLRRETRKQAVFWLGQAAGDKALAGLDSLAAADDEDMEVREAAVFAISQLPPDRSIPTLIRIAREHRDPRLRQRAMFWLAQSDDPRAVDLFAEILTRK